MKTASQMLRRQLLSVILILAMVFTMVPAAVSYADESYGYQPEGVDNTANSMKLIDVCGLTEITKLEETSDYYMNRIEGTIDGTKAYKVDGIDDKSGIYFTYTMSAGMNNFNRDWFLQKNMGLIKIYKADAYGNETGDPVAEYSNGNGLLQFWGSHLTENINNHGTQMTDELYFGVEQGVLGTGTYVIVFGKNICGNNADKQLGKDIKFQFTVKAAPALDEMITIAEEFVQNVKDQNLISDTEPDRYSQAEVDKIDAAIAAARGQVDASDDEKEQASEALYTALEDFMASINFSIDSIDISGISSEVNVGDTGTAAAAVVSRPDSSQYKRVSWSVIKYSEGDSENGPAQDIPADNLTINKASGSWVAAYSGTVWVKAASVKDEARCKYMKVEIKAEEGVLAVNVSEKTMTVQQQVEKVLSAAGESLSDVTSLKVFTTGEGSLNSEDIQYINSMPQLTVLNMKNAALTSLPESAFSGHSALEEVVLPDSLQSIGQRAFYNCASLKKIEIPAAVESIGGGAFAGCTAMDETLVIHAAYPPTYVTNGITTGDAFDGVAGKDTPSSVKSISVPYSCAADYKAKQGWRSFSIIEGEQQILKINFTASGTLQQAAEAAMKEAGTTEDQVTDLIITSPEGVQLSRSDDVNGYLQTHFLYATTIDVSGTEFEDNKCNANTFKERISLKHISLPESTTTIGGTCFYGCKNLREIVLPESLGNMGTGAFGECNLADKTVVSHAVEPPEFSGTVFPDQVTEILVPPQSVEAYKTTTGWNQYRDHIASSVTMALNKTSVTLEAPASCTLTASPSVYGGDPDDVTVKWSSSNTSVAKVSASMGKSVTVTALKAGSATITASDITGNVTAVCTVTVKAMAAPKTVKAASAAYNKTKVTWTGVSGASGYEVFRATKKTGTYTKIRTLTASARSYTDTGRATGTTYYYKVRAYKTVNKTNYAGSYSAIVSAKPALAKVSSVKTKKNGTRKIKVSWKRVTGASGYTVARSLKKTKSYKTVKTIKSGKTVSYTTGKLKKGKKYYFKVRAYRTVSGKKVYGAYSSVVSRVAR